MTYHSRMTGDVNTLALHCSGASGRQWRRLQEHGAAGVGQWHGQHAFSLPDEAERILSLPELGDSPLHLVGHSYGGGVALKIAATAPERIASLSLYEPSAFHLLHVLGPRGRAAFSDIRRVARAVADALVSGDYAGGAQAFVDYWNGPGSWAAMKPELQADMVRYMPKACLDFRALFEDDTPRAAYRAFRFPVLVMRGEFAPAPTRVVAEGLGDLIPGAASATIAGAGHMGPFTHSEAVNERILAHIVQAASIRELEAA
ncbi:MAG TPA: alpha/beta hydrolase [Aestuariivirgaceae bacterium]|nr:alpha/beta hydrolase [Aestuariivirgaceae bacterium]